MSFFGHTGGVKQDRESPTFMSAVGHTDKRLKLDKAINREDSRYYRALSAMAAKIAYENKAFIKTTVESLWKVQIIYNVHVYWLHKDNNLYQSSL